jgi:hypothetical protein
LVGNSQGKRPPNGGNRSRVLAAVGAHGAKIIPPLEPWIVQFAFGVMLICGFLALASFLKAAFDQLRKWSAGLTVSFRNWRDLWQVIDALNADETTFLKGQVAKNEMTTQLHPFNARGIPNFVHQAAMYQGLQNKGIVTVGAVDPQGRIQTITIVPAAWKKLKKKFKSK